METEKIKTDLLRMLKDFMYGAPTNLEIFADKVINLFDSQFKQPPVSVMPGDEDMESVANYLWDKWALNHEGHVYLTKSLFTLAIQDERILSLSKEAPKEQESGNYFCAQWSDVGFVCEEQCDRCKKAENMPAEPPSKERETAIELCSCGAPVSESYDGYCKDCG